jgi:tripeptide aminopeptidase
VSHDAAALSQLADGVVRRTCEIGGIPAPTGHERRRAELVEGWWRVDGWRDVRVDGVGNVWARVRDGAGPAILLCAHLDTVFGAEVDHDIRRDGTRLLGPGVGDDDVAVAALSAVGSLLDGVDRSLYLVATVGEEGLGNLRGIRAALSNPAVAVGAVVAVEGNYLGRVSLTGVGSLRLRVRLRGPGGHAWEHAAAPSAVHGAAALVVGLCDLRADDGRSTVNVGRLAGGEAINARAREAWFDVDLRADDATTLAALEASARRVFDPAGSPGLTIAVDELGRRPAGALAGDDPLVVAAVDALREVGRTPAFVSTSTDANAAHEAGVPAVALGITEGGGEHTPGEWIDTRPIPDGVAALAATIRFYGRRR